MSRHTTVELQGTVKCWYPSSKPNWDLISEKKANNLTNRWEMLRALCLKLDLSVFIQFPLFLFQGLKSLTSRCHLQQFCGKHLTLRWTSTSTGWLTNSAIGKVFDWNPVLYLLEANADVWTIFWSLRWWDHHLYLIMFFYNYAVIYKTSGNKMLSSYTVNCEMLVYCLKCVLLPCVVLLCAHQMFMFKVLFKWEDSLVIFSQSD